MMWQISEKTPAKAEWIHVKVSDAETRMVHPSNSHRADHLLELCYQQELIENEHQDIETSDKWTTAYMRLLISMT